MTVAPVSVLTQRQKQVLALMLSGYTSEQMAEALVITVDTVRVHRHGIYTRLGLRNAEDHADRRALYAWAFAAGVLRVRL